MPKGSPSAQTIATEKYTKKVGIISKSYKLKKELVDEFAEACDKAGTSQATQLSLMMRQFIEEVNESE